jgi:hypothetical protein
MLILESKWSIFNTKKMLKFCYLFLLLLSQSLYAQKDMVANMLNERFNLSLNPEDLEIYGGSYFEPSESPKMHACGSEVAMTKTHYFIILNELLNDRAETRDIVMIDRKDGEYVTFILCDNQGQRQRNHIGIATNDGTFTESWKADQIKLKLEPSEISVFVCNK